MKAVALEHISKTYDKGTVLAVNDVSFSVNKGELFGLIGPDGAGKTSLFRILTTLLRADKGNATVAGYDVLKDYKSIRSKVGYMPGRFSLYQDLTVQENLSFFATIFGTTIEANYELIKKIYVQIKPFKDRRAGKLSGGMKQKLALCCALIHKPEVLLLDEPTTGVDVVSRREFWDMLKELKQEGITILVSTPYMDEASLCERIALMQSGRILSMNTPANIIHAYSARLYAAKADNIYSLLMDLRKLEWIEHCYAFGEYLHFNFTSDEEMLIPSLNQYIEGRGHINFEVKEISAGIEDCFIRLMSEDNSSANANI